MRSIFAKFVFIAVTTADADLSQVAGAGWSWGGISNLFAAARDNRIAALVRLIEEKHMPEAVAVMTLNVRLHPESRNVYDMLGQAFARAGQKKQALEAFKKSVDKNPDDQNAKNWIRNLTTASNGSK